MGRGAYRSRRLARLIRLIASGATRSRMSIFSQSFCEREPVSCSTSLTASSVTGSSKFCTYSAAALLITDNISEQ